MFDNQIRTRKIVNGISDFRYNSSISRDYYRDIQEIRAEKRPKAIAAAPLHSTGFVPQPAVAAAGHCEKIHPETPIRADTAATQLHPLKIHTNYEPPRDSMIRIGCSGV